MLGFLLKGLIIGVLVSAPMGPTGVLCIQRTINKGRMHGFVTGLGAALSDIIYAAITGFGMGFVIDFIEANIRPLQVLGSVVLLVFAYVVYNSNPVKSLSKKKEVATSYTQDFITALLLTLSNALIIFLYIGLFARLSFWDQEMNYSNLVLGLLGIGVGAIAWWLAITYFVGKIKNHFNVRGMKILNHAIGIVMTIIALFGLVYTFWS
ncbi:MAG: LysE family translocator [Tannerellaceae bacterium]